LPFQKYLDAHFQKSCFKAFTKKLASSIKWQAEILSDETPGAIPAL
jgi:quinol monooxygenase YgiN